MLRARSEDGIALALAVVVTASLSILAASVLTFAASNLRTVEFQRGRAQAEALAEAGVAHALSILNAPGANVLDPGLLAEGAAELPEGVARWRGVLEVGVWQITGWTDGSPRTVSVQVQIADGKPGRPFGWTE